MNEAESEADDARTRTTVGDDETFRNNLLAAWLDNVEAGRERSLADYQSMFPGREEQVAAELSALTAESADEATALDANAPRIPDVVLIEEIGRGGQGVVYRGRQGYVEREVAVKVLTPSTWSDSFAARFHREAKTLAALRHPGIVACYQAGTTDDGRGYMVMEFIDGPNLREWLTTNGPMRPDAALRLCRDLALALEHAHESGIIHRDIKPENVLLGPVTKPTDRDFPFEVKLADLGLARATSKLLGDGAQTQLTPAGLVMGSPRTMAPEQFDDPNRVDHRADIYGLGCVLFHALTGQAAFQAATFTGAIKEKLFADLPDVRTFVPDVHAAVAALVQSMMAPDLEDRPRTHTELATACDELIGVETKRRRKLARVIVAMVLGLLVLVAVVDPWGMVHAPSVIIDEPEFVFAGQTVTLTARQADGDAAELTYSWRQTGGGPRLTLAGTDAATTSFTVPSDLLGTTLAFEVAAANRWRTGTASIRLRILDPTLAPLPPGKVVSLLHRQREKVLDDWPDSSGTGTWQGADDHLGANGWCRDSSSRSRTLPLGHWLLSGAIEPIKVWDSATRPAMKPKQAGIRLEFAGGHAIVLGLQDDAGDTYTAGLDHVSPQGRRTELGARTRHEWSESSPVQFRISWDGSTVEAGWGTEVDGADWTVQRIKPSAWPTPHPPSRLTLFLVRGRACFCRLALVGR